MGFLLFFFFYLSLPLAFFQTITAIYSSLEPEQFQFLCFMSQMLLDCQGSFFSLIQASTFNYEYGKNIQIMMSTVA